MSNSLQPHGLYSTWNSPGQNTGEGSHSLLQGIFSTQGSNPGLLHCRQILYGLSHQGSPVTQLCFLMIESKHSEFSAQPLTESRQNDLRIRCMLLGGWLTWRMVLRAPTPSHQKTSGFPRGTQQVHYILERCSKY